MKWAGGVSAARKSLRMSKNLRNPEVLRLLDILFTSTYVNHLIHNSPAQDHTDRLDEFGCRNDIAATRNWETRYLGSFGNPELAIQELCIDAEKKNFTLDCLLAG